ncbi:MAG TPA: HEAT repeat domain-containing protein [Nitrospirae bacterium]|nr:HEAT repeat domain-containing protein [Nitrospirota bacterium]HDK82248.1 HEAT repeat domain-containing protein [Nitrospirota bacterium]
MLKMLTNYMEDGFLENIIDMFKQDKSLYPLIGDMLGDERGRVRLGTVALVEHMRTIDPDAVLTAIPGVAKLLKNPNVAIRGDAAYLLGLIDHKDALPFLSAASKDENELVRKIVKESIIQIENSS